MAMEKKYDYLKTEKEIQQFWEDKNVFRFDINSDKPVYGIDNPPSFTSGTLHIGHLLNHTWIDLMARYKRMSGYNVYFPLGFDCHGLPTELKVAKEFGIDKNNRKEFKDKCEEWTTECAAKMVDQYRDIGYSADWSQYYETRSDDYKRYVQHSLLDFLDKGMIYREKHPVLWCPHCETALAKAEVGYLEKPGILYYVEFDTKSGKKITIATTRPEMMNACVAVLVHPDDNRYRGIEKDEAILPIFDRSVPIFCDAAVDMEFGTGAVYVCTFGDEQDILWQKKFDLPVREVIDQRGHMKNSGEFDGMYSKKARKQIVEKLKKLEKISREEQADHRVLCHTDRCDTPIELLSLYQWFIKVKPFINDIKKEASKINWFPAYMKGRLDDWADAMDWDWVISRQRVYGTPIPFWYCKDCGKIIAPLKEELPIDPALEKAKFETCPECNSKNIVGETDVCDCWVDSSVTPLVLSKWLDDRQWFEKTYPNYMRPQGTEIIRTWAFYTIFRCSVLTGEQPFKDIVINGMVAGADGKKMSKSRGNVVAPEELKKKYSSDAIRQWASNASLGEDYPISYKELDHSQKFMNKLWNASAFIDIALEGFDPLKVFECKYTAVDKWILARHNLLVKEVTDSLDKYEFSKALQALRVFFWNDFSSYYLEMVKSRIYEPEKHSDESRMTAQKILYDVLFDVLLMLSPFTPHMTEAIYQNMYSKDKRIKSIHVIGWPKADKRMVHDYNLKQGELAKAIIAAVRKKKSGKSISLNKEVSEVQVILPQDGELRAMVDELSEDIRHTVKAVSISIVVSKPSEHAEKVEGFENVFVETLL